MKTIKVKTGYAIEEQETILLYDKASDTWTMDTRISTHWNKALKQGWTIDTKYVTEDGSVKAMILKQSGNAISIRDTSKKRTMSDEQKAVMVERLKQSKTKK